MIGVRSGLAKQLKEKNPAMVRQALAFKNLPQKLRQNVDSAIKIVNYIKSSALNSRLFTLLYEDLDSDHKVLLLHTYAGYPKARLHELKEEVIIFFELKEKHDFLTMFKDDILQWNLAYLIDIFSGLNELNLKLQDRNGTIIDNYDYI
nr:unnamed protein product [Callosobruchus analis]